MKNLQEFLHMCSGADPSTLRKSPTESNKYVGIGGAVLFTAILATLASGYALYTVFNSLWISLLFGVIWGLMIFNLDRFIVSSMKQRGSFFRDLWVAIPRVALAVVIALVIATPLELKLFEKEIDAELIIMEQEVIAEQEEALRGRYMANLLVHDAQIEELNNEIIASKVFRDQLAREAVAEADGTGGSQRQNMGPIYALKKAEAVKANEEYQLVLASNNARIAEVTAGKELIEKQMAAELESIERVPYNGMAARIAALDRIGADHAPIAAVHIFIFLLFLLIETAPILAKLISYRGPYDLHLHKHEHAVAMYHKEVTQMASHDTEEKLKYYTQVGTARVNARIKEERAKIDQELKQTIDEIQRKGADLNWETEP